MDVKQAVTVAKEYVSDLYAAEQIRNLGLEEVEFDDSKNLWSVTLGFSRPWDHSALARMIGQTEASERTYKLVTISANDNSVVSVKHRKL